MDYVMYDQCIFFTNINESTHRLESFKITKDDFYRGVYNKQETHL